MISIKNLTDVELITRTKTLVSQERQLLVQVLHHLREIDSRRLYLERGYSSLFSFCVEFLGYEESQAQRRISASRLLREIPEVEQKIEKGSLSLTALTQAQSFFRQEALNEKPLNNSQKKEILGLLENKTTRECEKELIKLRPEALPHTQEKTRVITEEFSELKIILKNETLIKLNKLKNLLSSRNLSLQDLIDFLADEGLKKFNPASKIQKTAKTHKIPETHAAQKGDQKSRHIPTHVKQQVWKRDDGCCTFTDPLTKKKCGSRHKLHLDHIKPWAAGGLNTLENLRLYCTNHNKLWAIQFYGKEKISTYTNLVPVIA